MTKSISFRVLMTPRLRRDLEELAQCHHRSASDMARILIEDAVASMRRVSAIAEAEEMRRAGFGDSDIAKAADSML